MFVGITNTPRDYAWGSTGEISALLGRGTSDRTEAELWLGEHPGSPAVAVDGPDAGRALGDIHEGRLPFLLKLLAAGSPLSLQAHPTMEQAAAGFERENAAGIPLDAPHRNYRDAFHKPEIIVALSEEFHALCGFRPAADVRATIATLLDAADSDESAQPALRDWSDRLDGDDAIRDVFAWLIERGDGVDALVGHVSHLAQRPAFDDRPELRTVRDLARAYPGDPGIVISLLLHRVTLRAGEALWLPAGNIHAYLRGVGVELMAASDNVLRGGLTPKHVDVPELLEVLDFRPMPVPRLLPVDVARGVDVFDPGVPDFELTRVDLEVAGGSAQAWLPSAGIAVCVRGSAELRGTTGAGFALSPGAVYISADEAPVDLAGDGLVFIATAGRAATAA